MQVEQQSPKNIPVSRIEIISSKPLLFRLFRRSKQAYSYLFLVTVLHCQEGGLAYIFRTSNVPWGTLPMNAIENTNNFFARSVVHSLKGGRNRVQHRRKQNYPHAVIGDWRVEIVSERFWWATPRTYALTLSSTRGKAPLAPPRRLSQYRLAEHKYLRKLSLAPKLTR
jgi:hypothetical protein